MTQTTKPRQTLMSAAPRAHNDAEPAAAVCPTYGRSDTETPSTAPFDAAASGILDLVLVARDALRELQAALEAGMLS